MKISIITPTWNRAGCLARMFASVGEQSPPPHEHIIVDNLSSDATAALVQDYARRAGYPVVHRREADQGLYDAMNQGIARAQGDAFYFLNDDDCLNGRGALGLLGQALSECRADFVFGDVFVVNPDTGAMKHRTHRQVNRFTLAEKSICQQATLYSRRILEKVGLFDATLSAAADYDWVLRAFFQHSARAVYLRRPVARFFLGGISNAPGSRDAFEREMEVVRARHFTPDDLARARRFRRIWRKLPWGLALMPDAGSGPRCDVLARLPIGGRLLPNPMAWCGF